MDEQPVRYEVIQTSKEVYPCFNEDCVSYTLYTIKRPMFYPGGFFLLEERGDFPNILFACFFCDKFNCQDMFQAKE